MKRKLLLEKALSIIALSTATLGFGTAQSMAAENGKEKVAVEFYVMSQCPFGTQVEESIAPVLTKLNGHVRFSLDFIGDIQNNELSSMHGLSEVNGDKVQLCASKYNPHKYMEMIICMNTNPRAIPGNWKDCATRLGLDVAKINTCYTGQEGKNLLKLSFEKSKRRNALGSPTIFIDGKPYVGPRSEIAFTRAICQAITNKPTLCASLPAPVKVPITIVTDKRCKECNTDQLKQIFTGMFPAAEITIIDYNENEGKQLFDKLGIKFLPAVLFGKEVKKAENYQRIQRFLLPVKSYLALMMGSKFDPTKEICDNHKDDTNNNLVDCADPDCINTLVCRKELPKKLDIFVMAQCPYGVMALDAMKEVLDNFKNDIEFEVHYIAAELTKDSFNSLHGQDEVDEDIRGLCVMKHYPRDYKWMDYILCRNKNIHSTEWESCTGKNGIVTQVIRKCFEGGEGKKLLSDDIKIAQSLGIGASPTWLANNKYIFSGIDAETVRANICEHNQNMANCQKRLSGPSIPKAEADCGDR